MLSDGQMIKDLLILTLENEQRAHGPGRVAASPDLRPGISDGLGSGHWPFWYSPLEQQAM